MKTKTMLGGLEREEEHLPDFVFSPAGMEKEEVYMPMREGLAYKERVKALTVIPATARRWATPLSTVRASGADGGVTTPGQGRDIGVA